MPRARWKSIRAANRRGGGFRGRGRGRPEARRELRLPTSLAVRVVPLEALTSRRFFSPRAAVPALAIVAALGLRCGSPPADARQPQQESSPVAKASFTPPPPDTPPPT